MAFKTCAVLVLAAGLVAGCSALDEPRRYYLQQEWQALRGIELADITERTVGLHPSNTVPLAERTQPCRDLPLEQRQTVQDGVVDAAAYTQCWRAPYYNVGQRMENRPYPWP